MSENEAHASDPAGELSPGPDWNLPLPAVVPTSTFWPAGLAFGITLLLWGIVTSLIIVAFGSAAIIVALVGWIGDIRHEAKTS